MYELEIKKEKDNNTLGRISIVYKDDKYEYNGKAYVYRYFGSSYTAVCGSQTLQSPYGCLTAVPTTPGKKAWNKGDIKQHWVENGAFKEIQLALFKNTVEDLIADYPKYSLMFGGRMNITKENYVNQLGVYSGSLARYIMKAKIGTITSSHVHQNNNHKSPSDFSLHQFFVWSPPTIDVIPINKSYVGVFSEESHGEKSVERLEKVLGKGKEWVMYRPRYFLKKPGETANDANVEQKKKTA